jgi:hypothetical protein
VQIERVDEGQPADLRLVDTVARYTRAAWFLNQLACPVSPAGCSAEGDALAAQARAERDPQARMALLAQAERAVTAANGFIPIARPLRWSLVRSGVTGFSPIPGAGTRFRRLPSYRSSRIFDEIAPLRAIFRIWSWRGKEQGAKGQALRDGISGFAW